MIADTLESLWVAWDGLMANKMRSGLALLERAVSAVETGQVQNKVRPQ